MMRWALLAFALLAATPAAAQDYAADQLAACVVGSAIVRIEMWHEAHDEAVDQAWKDCDVLIDKLPPDAADADLPLLHGISDFVESILGRLSEDEAAFALPPGYTLEQPVDFF